MEHHPLSYCDDGLLRLIERRELSFDSLIAVGHGGIRTVHKLLHAKFPVETEITEDSSK